MVFTQRPGSSPAILATSYYQQRTDSADRSADPSPEQSS